MIEYMVERGGRMGDQTGDRIHGEMGNRTGSQMGGPTACQIADENVQLNTWSNG